MSGADESTPQGATPHAAVARLLRPLVRLLVARGITFPALTGLLRELYVDVAERDFTLPGKDQTDSRVSLLTGIHRREVRRLRGAGAPVGATSALVSCTGRIMARWQADPTLLDARGRPRALARLGPAPSFEALVASVTRDLRARAVLDEWLDRGLAAVDDRDRVVLSEAAAAPRGEPQLRDFGRDLHDHVAASVANALGGVPRFLERAVHQEGLSEDLARRLEMRAREIALEALARADREAQAARAGDPGGPHRWSLGLYVYAEAAPARPRTLARPDGLGA